LRLMAAFLIASLGFGQTQRSLISSYHIPEVRSGVGVESDTLRFSSWSPASDGGPFNGGNVYGSLNDGVFGSGLSNLNFLKLGALDINNISGLGGSTVVLVNAMTDYGSAGTITSTCDSTSGGDGVKNMDNWVDGGIIYWNLFCQGAGPNYPAYKSWLLCSNDKGVHWENYAHVTANGNVCDSVNHGSTTGDIPGTLSTDVQWYPTGGVDNHLGKMGRLSLVQVCQDGATCPTLPGSLSNTFHYFVSLTQDGSNINHLYLHRYSGVPVLPASWTHYNAGSWDANPDNATAITLPWTPFAVSVIYSPEAGKFFLMADIGNAGVLDMASSTDLLTWTALPAVASSSVQQPLGFSQFSTFVLASKVVTPRGFRIALMSNGCDDSFVGCGTGTMVPANWNYTVGVAAIDFAASNARSGAVVGQ
jgi:hypothetical protein